MATEPTAVPGETLFTEIALLIFIIVFIGIVVWVLVTRKETFDRAAEIPLRDEPVEPRDPDADHPVHEEDKP